MAIAIKQKEQKNTHVTQEYSSLMIVKIVYC